MQPYFIPYAGYFRLFAVADLFVIYDCVQFPRRGWVHRNRLINTSGELSWLTLPLMKAPQDIKISELLFAHDAVERMQNQLNKFPLFNQELYLDSAFKQLLTSFSAAPVTYIIKFLKLIGESLQLPFNTVQSSMLELPTEIKGQDRIVAIAKHFRADEYINASGGFELYDKEFFSKQGLKLKFLSPYVGSYDSILPRLFNEDIVTLSHEIKSQISVI